jgi:hypothetical protein
MALTLTDIDPEEALYQSDTPITVTLTGTDFQVGTVDVLVNGAPDTWSIVDDTTGTMIINMATVTTAIDLNIELTDGTVTTPALVFRLYEGGPIAPTEDEIPPAEEYHPLDETYAEIAAETSEPSVATGTPVTPDAPVTNLPGGGLPESPREPYPTGNPPVARSFQQIRQGR